MKIAIEQLQLEELRDFLREQALDAFPDLKDGRRLNMLAEKWSTNAEFCTCRDEKGCLIGMVAFYANRSDEAIVYIPHVYVNSRFRGQRVFTAMLEVVEMYTKNKGFQLMRLEVQKDNETAQKAYLHYGFSVREESSNSTIFMQYCY